MKSFITRAWKLFVDLCSAWPWLKPVVSLIGSAIVALFGYIEHIPMTYVVCATLVGFASILWAWNQLIWRGEFSTLKGMIQESRTPTIDLPDIHAPLKPLATQSDLESTTITGKTVYIYSVPRDGLFLKGKKFVDCHIEGPAVIVLINVMFSYCRFGHPGDDPRALLFPIAQDRTMTGVIGLVGCDFHKCRINNIGVAGPRKELDLFVSQITKGGGV